MSNNTICLTTPLLDTRVAVVGSWKKKSLISPIQIREPREHRPHICVHTHI